MKDRFPLFPLALAWTALLSVLFGLALVNGWFGPASEANRYFCEYAQSGLLREPVNTVSNLAFVASGLAIAWQAADGVEFYGNYGEGYHSNDVRGAVTTTPVPVLVSGEGKEVGARFQSGPFTLTATYWWLNVGSELKFVGDSNAVEPTGASNRHGYELVAFWRPLEWLAIDAHYTASHARYDNGDHIPNAFENAAALGVSAVSERWEGSIRLRHLGPYPLLEDNSVRDKGSNVVNARGAWKADRFEVYAEVLNILDSHDKDMAYWYEAYIPTFDAAPVEGRLSRVVEPRTLRVGLKAYF